MASSPGGSMVRCPGCRTQFQPRAVNENYTRCPQCGRFLDVLINTAERAPEAEVGDYGLTPTEVSPPAVVASPPAVCPHCHTSLPAGAVLCVKCGYDLRKGRKLRTLHGAAAEAAASQKTAEGNKRRCPVCGSALLARETRCNKCKTRTPLDEQQPRPAEEISDETGAKIIKVDQQLRERQAWFAGRTLMPVRDGTAQRLVGCGCDVGAIVAGWVLWAAKPLVVLFSIASFAYLLPSGFVVALLGSMVCGLLLFAATFLVGFFLGFPFGFLLGLLGFEDVGGG